MYSLAGIKKGITNPRYIFQEIDRLYYSRLKTRSFNEEGIDFFDRDWDNLMILDACRLDLFEEVADLPGETTAVETRGSATREFLRGTFDGRTLDDTVYVTASPMLYRHRDEIDVSFHDVINIWQEDGWNDNYRTVLPETVREATLDAATQYPNKRLLVHFMQPHYPFIGPTGQRHFDLDRLDFQWDLAASGELGISEEVLYRAYSENLEAVLPAVEELLDELTGTSVVTADHGQMFGERLFPIPIREYGHPPGLYTDELVTVPWHVYEDGTRRKIEAGDRTRDASDHTENEELARERLQDLGYLE